MPWWFHAYQLMYHVQGHMFVCLIQKVCECMFLLVSDQILFMRSHICHKMAVNLWSYCIYYWQSDLKVDQISYATIDGVGDWLWLFSLNYGGFQDLIKLSKYVIYIGQENLSYQWKLWRKWWKIQQCRRWFIRNMPSLSI